MRLVVVDGDQRIKTVAHRRRQALGHALREQRPGLVSGSPYRAAQHRIGRRENELVAESLKPKARRLPSTDMALDTHEAVKNRRRLAVVGAVTIDRRPGRRRAPCAADVAEGRRKVLENAARDHQDCDRRPRQWRGRGRRAATSWDVDRGRTAGWERDGRMTDDDRDDEDDDRDEDEDEDDEDDDDDDEDVLRC